MGPLSGALSRLAEAVGSLALRPRSRHILGNRAGGASRLTVFVVGRDGVACFKPLGLT
jgi:hypothetical protein